MKTLKDFLEARMIATGDFKISASGRKVRRLIKVGDDDYNKADDIDKDGDVDADDKKLAKEQVEDIQEISSKLAGNYYAAATKKHIEKVGVKPNMYDRIEKDMGKNRKAGIDRAFSRLTKEEVELEEATVKKANYSWGKMVTVHHGADHSYPLHPEHQEAIKNLKHDEKTSFKDETGTKVTAHREGDNVHLTSNRTSKKTTVAHSHFTESYITEQEHLVHVSDGSKYDETPHPKDIEHVKTGAMYHGGKFDGHSDKGAYFKFKSREDAEHFKRHVDKCPHRTCHADVHESVELDEAADKQDSRLMQLARLGLLDKSDVATFRTAMQTFKSDKQLSIKQRNMLLSVYNDLVNMVTGDDAMFARAKLDIQKEEVELDEDAAKGLAAKAAKSGISIGTLRKVYNRGVAAWNSGHRPGTTPQQWGMARVNSYITKGKGTYHGADKDLHEGGEPTEFDVNDIDEACWDTHKQVGMKKKGDKMVPNCVPKNEETVQEDARMNKAAYHKGMSDSMKAARVAHWKKMDKKSDRDPSAYEPAPGDATAKTKPSVHTKKYHDMYGESVEQIDEISKETLASYIPKAAKDARIHGQIATDFENRGKTARKPGSKDIWNRLSMKYKEKAWKRDDGISKAVTKLTKEGTYSHDVERAFPASGVKTGTSAPKGTSTMPKDKKLAKGQPAGSVGTKTEGYYKDIDTNEKEDKRLGVWKKETPWRKIKPGSDTTTDKSGAKHTPMSKVRHLARLALKKTSSK